jgi:putative transposase
MGSRLRLEYVGATYHVNIKAVAGVHAFPDNAHREHFLELMRDEIARSDWTCFGYTILGTHFHVVVKLNARTLSSGFQRLNSMYARWFNRGRGRTGAMWQARFYDVPVESAYQFLETQRYLALNARRANLVEEPEDWQYCHYGALVGKHPRDELVDEDAILRLFGRDRARAQLRLRAFVDESDRRRRRQMFLRASSDDTRRAWSRIANARSAVRAA